MQDVAGRNQGARRCIRKLQRLGVEHHAIVLGHVLALVRTTLLVVDEAVHNTRLVVDERNHHRMHAVVGSPLDPFL